ncbi:MAG: MBL fold metallo-hydrolase [Paludibacteraceae bacterium]|nr:MBL fold metallo-hydrolase [Paludibacteraceae bacterium]
MEPLQFFSIGSGSSGNCYYLGTSTYGVLIDAGISIRTIKKELRDHGISLSNIWGVFITHDHTDHIKSVGVLGEILHLPVYVTQEMFVGINKNYHMTQKLAPSSVRFYKKGEHITLRDFQIQTFPVSHDATDCVGFTFTYDNHRFVIATDLGYIGKEAAEHICKANYLVIETNYDEMMLKNGPYPYPLKERVRSHTGHLSNEHTAQFLASNPNPALTHIFLCHLSKENNTPDKAYEAVHNALEAKGIMVENLIPLPRTEATKIYILR